jgi:hypothetical protein
MKIIWIACVLIVWGFPTLTLRQTGVCHPEVEAVKELGSIGYPVNVTARDGGASALIGGQVLWTFGDTLFHPKSVDGVNLRSNTAALADPSAPLEVHEPLDANGAPFPFLPFTDDELQFNAQHSDQRIALWPASVIPHGERGGFVFYLKLIVKPGFLNYEFIGTGLAYVSAGSTTAIREDKLLFNVPDPLFNSASLIGSEVYVYGQIKDGSNDQAVAVARVPIAQIRDRTAYRFWNGTTWDADPQQAVAVLSGIPGEVSVSHNAFLKRYIAVHSAIFSNKIVLKLAAQPEGVWGDPIETFSGLTPVEGTLYAGREHPELALNDGRTIVISYYRPLGGFKGELRLVNVTFKTGCPD